MFLVLRGRVADFLPLLEQWQAVVLDVETTGLDTRKDEVLGFALGDLYDEAKEAYYFPIAHKGVDNIDRGEAERILALVETKPVLGWNIKFDLRFLSKYLGRPFAASSKIYDVIVMARLLEKVPNPNLELSYQHARHFGTFHYKGLTEEVEASRKHTTKLPMEQIAAKCCYDVYRTRDLYLYYKEQMPNSLRKLYTLESRLTRVLYNMETTGIRVDVDAAQALYERFEEIKQRLRKELADYTGIEDFNPESREHINVLMNKRGVPPVKTTYKGNPSWDREALNSIDDPYAFKVAQHRALRYEQSNLLTHILLAGNTLHTTYQNWRTVTGRLSSKDPNLQAIPKGYLQLGERGEENQPLRWSEDGPDKSINLRRLFIPRQGKVFLVVDYRQIEMFVAAWLMSDPKLLKLLEEEDFHLATAKLVWGREDKEARARAKGFNFGLLYGMGLSALAKFLKVDAETARRYRDEYFAHFTRYRPTIDKIRVKLEVQGYVENVYGRRYWLDPSEAMLAFNWIVQGSAADYVKFRLVFLEDYLRERGITPLLTTHDDIVFEAPSEVLKEELGELIPKLEEGDVFGFRLPVEAKIGERNLAELVGAEEWARKS